MPHHLQAPCPAVWLGDSGPPPEMEAAGPLSMELEELKNTGEPGELAGHVPRPTGMYWSTILVTGLSVLIRTFAWSFNLFSLA